MFETFQNVSVKNPGVQPKATIWEQVATTSWGRYVTSIETELIKKGEKLAGPPGQALEIGCEGGRWSKLLADLNWTMTCTDISQETLDVCRKKVPTAKCILVDPGARILPVGDSSFSLALCVEVPPVIQSDWFLPEMFRVLGANGVLVGTFLNRRSWRGAQARLRANLAGGMDRRFYVQSYPIWKKSLIGHGFELLDERGFCWGPFSRASDSRFVPLAAQMERRLQLHRLPSLSPWVAFIARKKA